METVGYLLALAVGAVFVAAAVPKLRRPDQTAASFGDLGLPAPATLARLVPVAELLTAGLLVGWPRAGAVVAVVFLGAFTAVLARAVRSGSDVTCVCFGARSSEPVTVRDLVRNALLLAAACGAALAADPVAPDLPGAVAASMVLLIGWVVLGLVDLRQRLGVVFDNTLPGEVADQQAGLGRGMSGGVWIVSYVLLWVAVVVLGVAVVALLRQVGVLHARIRPLGVHFAGEGPEQGSTAPAVFDYPAAELTVVAFTSPTCSVCHELLPGLAALRRQYRDVAFHVVDHEADTTGVFEAFNVRSTPYVVGVDRAGRVQVRGVTNSIEQIELLIEETSAAAGGGNGGPVT